MKKINANKRTFIRWKIYIDRAKMYIGYIQFIMIGFVFIKAYRDTSVGKLIFDHLFISIPVLLLIFIALSLVIGRLDTIYGLREEELRNATASNPVMRELHSSMEEIKNDLQYLKNKK